MEKNFNMFIGFIKDNKELLVPEIITFFIGLMLERLFSLTKIPKKVYDGIRNKLEKSKEIKKLAIDELYPIIEELEDSLNYIDSIILDVDINNTILNREEFALKIEELLVKNDKLDKFLDRVAKPKNLRKRLKQNRTNKTLYEKIYIIKSIVQAVEMLSWKLLVSDEEQGIKEHEFENYSIEIEKVLGLTHKIKKDYNKYYVKYKI